MSVTRFIVPVLSVSAVPFVALAAIACLFAGQTLGVIEFVIVTICQSFRAYSDVKTLCLKEKNE